MVAAGWAELTPREREVLTAVERRLSNAEIAAEMYVSVRTVETHIAALRRKLGVDSRAMLIEAARARRSTAVQVPRNSFVGRDRDVEAVRRLLDRDRWVTVVGPAGCGKTRLVLELAAESRRVPVVAELERASAGTVVGLVAKAVGLGVDSTSDLVPACAVALQAQRYLLVLDNVDRVADDVRDLLARLLAQVGALAVLVTSRSPVGGSDETVYPLAPLAVEDTPGSPAVRLFLDRARTAAPESELSADDVGLVAEVCRRLDGLPLAIELAAARTRHLPLPELASRLGQDLGRLDRVGPVSRHRTLATALEWTWDLLEDDERVVLSQLAALPGTFDLDLAEAVTVRGAGRVVLRLLDRSLVSPVAEPSDPQRFRLLQPLRAFVLERTEPGVVQEVRRAHASLHAALAAEMHRRARTDDSRAAAAEAARLNPEVIAAIGWALDGSEPELAIGLARALALSAEQYGPDLESLGALARVARDPSTRAVAAPIDCLEIGISLCYSDLDLVAELASLALDRIIDDRSELAARHLAGYADAYRHNARSALTHLAAAERLADELVDVWQLASIRQARGIALRDLGDAESAMAAFDSAMQTYARAGDAMHVNNTRYMMAATAVQSGRRTDAAVGWAEECATYATATGNRHELAHAVLTRTQLTGPPDEQALVAALDTFRAVGDLRCLTRSHLLLATGRPAAEQVTHLEQALEVATRARDVDNQERALAGLVRAQWESGAQRSSATALGALVGLVGWDRARSLCAPEILAQLDGWGTAIAEGRARFANPAPAQPR